MNALRRIVLLCAHEGGDTEIRVVGTRDPNTRDVAPSTNAVGTTSDTNVTKTKDVAPDQKGVETVPTLTHAPLSLADLIKSIPPNPVPTYDADITRIVRHDGTDIQVTVGNKNPYGVYACTSITQQTVEQFVRDPRFDEAARNFTDLGDAFIAFQYTEKQHFFTEVLRWWPQFSCTPDITFQQRMQKAQVFVVGANYWAPDSTKFSTLDPYYLSIASSIFPRYFITPEYAWMMGFWGTPEFQNAFSAWADTNKGRFERIVIDSGTTLPPQHSLHPSHTHSATLITQVRWSH